MIILILGIIGYFYVWALIRPDHTKQFKKYFNSRLHFVKKCATIKDDQK